MSWRLAYSLDTLRSQVDAAYPNRSKASDGTIGDAAHQAVPSDHNPNSAGVVTALDLTNDPGVLDAHALADRLLEKRHPDLKYLISNKRIAGDWTNWQWVAYNGTSDPHINHIHVSVGVGDDGQSQQPYDDRDQWNVKGDAMERFNAGDLQIITDRNGWQKGSDGKTNRNAVAYWTTGTGMDPAVWADQHIVAVNLAIELEKYGASQASQGNFEPVTEQLFKKKGQL